MAASQQVVIVKSEKSMVVAYLLLIFLGHLGLHRFYLGRTGTAITQLLLSLCGWATAWILIGFIPLSVVWIWLVADLFLTAGMVRNANEALHASVSAPA